MYILRGLLLATASLAACGPREPVDPRFEPDRPATWEVEDPDLYAVTALGSRVWAVGYWGAVFRSGDGGERWTRHTTGTRRTLFDVAFGDPRRGWAVGEAGTILRTRDGGETWTTQTAKVTDAMGVESTVDTHLFAVDALSAREAWAVGDMGVVLHVEDGESWHAVTIPPEVFPDEEVPDRIFNAVAFEDAHRGWIAGEFGTTLRTADGGESWAGERTLLDAPDDLYLFDLSLTGPHAAVTGLAGTVLLSEDDGSRWEPRRTPTSAPLYASAWSEGEGAAVGDRGVLYTTTDAGRSWDEPERPRLFNWLADVTRTGAIRLFAVGEKGLVLRSEDGGASWRQLLGKEPPPISGVSVPEPARSTEAGRSDRRIPVLGGREGG